MRQPKLIKALGYHRGDSSRLTDANLKLQHLYLFMALLDSNEEMKRRGLHDGKEISLCIVSPE